MDRYIQLIQKNFFAIKNTGKSDGPLILIATFALIKSVI